MDESGARVETEALEPDRAGRGLEGLRIVVRHGDVEGDALEVLRLLCASDVAVVLGAAVCRARISGLPCRSRRACSLSSAASLTSSLPVPRQAISAGEKFGQRQAAAGASRQWV